MVEVHQQPVVGLGRNHLEAAQRLHSEELEGFCKPLVDILEYIALRHRRAKHLDMEFVIGKLSRLTIGSHHESGMEHRPVAYDHFNSPGEAFRIHALGERNGAWPLVCNASRLSPTSHQHAQLRIGQRICIHYFVFVLQI